MPAQVSHILHGLACRDVWTETQRLDLAQGAFFLGCQGPDVFYHNQRSRPSGLLYGARIHRWGWGKFCATFARIGKRSGWGFEHPGFAFVAGWVAHGFLDRFLHPYIVWNSGWRVPSDPDTKNLTRSHAFFERILDVLFYESRQRENFFHCDWMGRLAGTEAFPDEFWEAFAQSLWRTYPGAYGLDDARPRARNAVDDAVGFLRQTDPREEKTARAAAVGDREEEAGRQTLGRYPRVALFHPFILPPDDFLNRSRRVWLHPVDGKEHRESAEDLFDAACDDGQKAFRLLAEAWDAPAVESEILFDRLAAFLGDGSLNLPGEDGAPQGPRFSKPLDFEHLLELQRRFLLKE